MGVGTRQTFFNYMPTSPKKPKSKGVNHHSNTPEGKPDKRLVIFLDHNACRRWYSARPELIHYDLDIYRQMQIETGDKLLWGFDLTSNEGYNAALDRIHYLTFNRN